MIRTLLAVLAALGTAALAAASPVATASMGATADASEGVGLEVVAAFGRDLPPGNVTVTPDGRILMSLHPFFQPAQRVVEVRPADAILPFPNARWNGAPDYTGIGLQNVLGLRADGRGIVWMLDNGGAAGRVVAWDTRADRLHRVLVLAPPTVREDSFLNDLAVDPVRGALFIADTATGAHSAVIAVDLATGLSRRLLEGHPAVVPEDVTMAVEGRSLMLGDAEARTGLNPITIDPASEWVYFGPMTGRSLYRIRARDLHDASLTDEALRARVERYGAKPVSNGITVDGAGNVYVTDITANAVGVTAADGSYRVLYQDDALLRWPDSLAVGPDGWIYLVTNQLHRSPPLNDGQDLSRPPFHLLRFPALGPTSVGR